MKAPPVTIYTIGHSTRSLDELIDALQAQDICTLADIRAFPTSRRLPHFNRESLEEELPIRGIAYVWIKELGGRRKKMRNDSPNTGLRNDSFRNYADYMMTGEFAAAVDKLVKIAIPTLPPKTGGKDGAPEVSQGQQTAGCSAAFGRSRDLSSLGMTPEDLAVGSALRMTHAERTNAGPATGNTAIMCAERVYFQCHRMLVSDYLTAHGHQVLHIEDDKRPVREHKLIAEARLLDGKLIYNAPQLF